MSANLNELLKIKLINGWNLFWLITAPISLVMVLTMIRVDLSSAEAVSSMILFAGSFSRIVQSLAVTQSKQNRALFRGSYGLAAIIYLVAGGDTYGVLR
jgi:hypothetical protein